MTSILLLLACGGGDPSPSPAPTATDATTPSPTTPSVTPTSGTTGETGTPPRVQVGPLQFLGEPPSRVLMISVDTFRKDHVGAYGDLDLTPRIDRLIDEGVALDDHMQCSNWTYPTTTCTLLGRSHLDNGFLPRLANGREPFPDGTAFLATWLSEAGFDTAITSRNGWLSSEWNSVQGYQAELGGSGMVTLQFDLALDHLATVPEGQPWFFHIHATEPHVPYDPPDDYLGDVEALDPIAFDLTVNGEHYAARDLWQDLEPETQALVLQHMTLRYQAEIRWFDDQLALGLDRLDEAGLLDDTLVVLWNDHGEQFWEHGSLTHAYDLHHEENDGFMVFWADNLLPYRHPGPTHATDLVPTLLRILDLPIPSEVTGHPLGERPDDVPRFGLSVARLGGISSVVHQGQKLIFDWDYGIPRRFDLAADPTETTDLWGTDAAQDAALWSLLRPQVEAAQALVPDQTVIWPDVPKAP